MAYYYKIGTPELPYDSRIQIHQKDVALSTVGPTTTFDFSKHVLIELLDDVTPELDLWKELGLSDNKVVVHKRIMVDSHRIHCRRAIVICSSSEEAKNVAQRLSQTKIMKRCICAVVVQELLSDLSLFEKQILNFGDKRPQHQLLFVTDLNRCREPASLAQYLREKFSSFGTILSVFVAEDKDGYAYPEGVIKFAHLSEAFAAELAYDQYVVGMERLSVTTHHNILLSQCDLRVRLREAHLRHNHSFNSTPSFRKNLSELLEVNENNSLSAGTPSEVSEHLNSNSINVSNVDSTELTNDSAEIADALINSCEDNLISCLKGITMCSDSSDKETIDDSSSITDDVLKTSINNAAFKPSSLDSRINNWIEGVTNSEFSIAEFNNHSTPIIKPDQYLENRNCSKSEVTSTKCSFVTCCNENNISIPVSSPLMAVNEDSLSSNENNTLINEASSSKSFHSFESAVKNSTVSLQCTSESSLQSIQEFTSTSQKRKNQNSMSCKLSLKSQRLDSLSQTSNNDLTLPINVSKSENTTRRLHNKKKSPMVRLKRLNSKEIEKLSSTVSQNQTNETSSKNYECNLVALNNVDPVAIKSLIARRSSRIGSRKSNRNLELADKESSVAVLDIRDNSSTDSPLRAWLKKELTYSSNKRLTSNVEKKIVCAAVKKDVLVSVGCSHVTCDYCYPGSTDLLLGLQ